MTVVTRKELNVRDCDVPGCTHEFDNIGLVQKCHPGVGVELNYCQTHGILHVSCVLCHDTVMLIAVAESVAEEKEVPCTVQ